MREVALRGVSAAPGIAVGKAIVLDRTTTGDAKVVAQNERAREVELARHSLAVVATEMEQIAAGLLEAGRRQEADIVETGALMAADPGLAARVEALITESGRSATDALLQAADESAHELAQLEDPMLALRADDVRSIGRRAAARASGLTPGEHSGIVIATALGPADVAEFALHAKGIALAGGGVTAHAAIVARSLGVPMVVALGPDVLVVQDWEEVVLDGANAALFRWPSPGRIADAQMEVERRRGARQDAIAQRLEPAQTKDGHRLRVLANAASVAELMESLDQGAEGVG
jgi:phosphoenolpyruvate-protein kinase (PTS system EI component)